MSEVSTPMAPAPATPMGPPDSSARAAGSCRACGDELRYRVGCMAQRLAELLEGLPSTAERLPTGLPFLRALADDAAQNPPEAVSPRIVRLRRDLGVSADELDLVVLAGLPEEHEGMASLLSVLHPRGEPYATPGLASQLLARDTEERVALRDRLEGGRIVETGLVELRGDAPFGNRTLAVAAGIWSALQGRDLWPAVLGSEVRPRAPSGLGSWLAEEGRVGVECVAAGAAATLHVASSSTALATDIAVSIAERAGCRWEVFRPHEWSHREARALALHAAIRGVVPILVLDAPVRDGDGGLGALEHLPGPLVLAGPALRTGVFGTRPLVRVVAPQSARIDGPTMWGALAPELSESLDEVASCLRLEPSRAAAVVGDARYRAALEGRPIEVSDLFASVRARVGSAPADGAHNVEPTLGWDDLVLEPEVKCELAAAADRVRHQTLVLDRWGLAPGRRGVRGVRILLHGPPGTGKSLAAEALAGRLGVDLLVVDLSQVVSKWIGETEKNLGRIFDAAEEAQSVLLFDEADALFAQRTEVSDAHDRYANLETSYLLTRLERFEGLAVLSTNIKRNIDDAFLRRLDFVLELSLPDQDRREAIWHAHLPADVPRAPDVSIREVARRYPLSGGLIRNAALGAAFLAAANGRAITRDHLSHSLRREHAKAGLAFPGPLPSTAETQD